MAASLGVLAAPLVCGTLGELVGWHWGFGAAGVGMLVSLAIYVAGWRWLPPDTLARTGGERPKLTAADAPVLAALAVLLVVVALFWIANGETLNAVIVWAKAHLDRNVGPLTMPASWMTAIQAAIGVSMAPLLIRLWDRQALAGREPNALGKMAIGCGFAAAGYAVLALACALSGGAPVPLLWVFGFYLLAQTGYLFVYPIGMALFSRAAPPAINALMIGIYFLSVFAGSLLVGWIGQFYERMSLPAFWLLHAGAAAVAGTIVLVLWKPLNRALG
jgi:POT family proton-dependent oligopeptide transporter